MRGFWAIYKRELIANFYSPVAYIVMVSFLIFNGIVFYFFMDLVASNPTVSGTRGPLQLFFGSTILSALTLMIFCPAVTMRTLAEEWRTRTSETLFTAPVSELSVVLGKYAGAMTLYLALWAPTVLYALVVRRYGPVDWGVLGAAYAGVTLIGASFLGVGLLMSAVARSQVTAFVGSFGIIGGLMFALGLGRYVFTEESQQHFFSYVNLWEHMEHFSVGMIDSRQLVYYGSVAVLSLSLTVRAVGHRREASQ
jgi:ABC-2 type transport system permease protein